MATPDLKPTVLIVDDTPENLMVMEGILQKDYNLKTTTSAKEAIDYAYATPPDLILLDVMMPEMDGFEACRQLKDNPKLRNVPVIFITAKNKIADEELGFSLGASDFIHKPISAPIVSARVMTHIKIKLMLDYLMNENSRLQQSAEQNSLELDQLKSFLWGSQFQRH